MKIEPFCAACAQWLIEYGIMRLKMPTNSAQVVKYRLTVLNNNAKPFNGKTTGTLSSIPHTST